jgi:uncharacterized protein YjdB
MLYSRLWLTAIAVAAVSCSSSPTTPSTTATTTTSATTPAPSTTFQPSISFTGGDVFVLGQSGQLDAIERPTASTVQDVTTTAKWESSNPSVATVSATGFVTAMALGATIIKASDSTAAGTLVVSVVAGTVKSVLIVGPTTMPTGQASELTASVSTADGGREVVTSGVAWQSSKPTVATVSDAGVLTAVSPGTTTITATYQGVVGSLTVTVVDVTVRSISFYGTTTVTRGATAQLTATATLGDGSSRIVTNSATWQSLNTDIATVSDTGLVTTLSTAGTATITATYLGTTGSVDVTVN